MKQKKEVKIRHYFVVKIAILFVIPWLKIKYRFSYKKQKELKRKGPFLILGNHTVPEDPMLLGFLFPFQSNYYVASEQIFNLGFLSKLLVWAVNPIKKAKSTSDLSTIRKSKTIIKQGGTIGMFAEGNVTYSGETTTINPAVVKYIRLMSVPVIFYNTEGLYLSNPRWAIYPKKGKSTGYIKRIMQPDEYKQLTDEQLYEIIKEELYVNCYDQKVLGNVAYKGKKLALGLERMLFMDLKTNQPFKTYSKDNQLLSTVSDFSFTYDEYGYLSNQTEKITLIEAQQRTIDAYVDYLSKREDNYLFDEMVILEQTNARKKIKLGKFKLNMYTDKLVFSSVGHLIEVTYDKLSSIAIQGKRKLIMYHQDETYLITLDEKSSPLKYLITYQYYQNRNSEDITNVFKFGL